MATTASPSRLETSVRELLEPVVASGEIDFVDLEIKGPPNRRVVRVYVDAVGGSLDIDRIATISQDVSNALDEADVINGAYTLQVSSPGVDRPLTTASDFARHVGRDVRIVAVAEDTDEVVGRLARVDGDTVVLDVDGTSQTIQLADVDHGRVELPW